MNALRRSWACLLAFAAFHAWLLALGDLPATLRVQGTVLAGVAVGLWLGWRHGRSPRAVGATLVAALASDAVLEAICARGAFALPVLGAPAAGAGIGTLLRRTHERLDRLCRRSLVAALSRAQMAVLALAVGAAVATLAVVQQNSPFLQSLTRGLPFATNCAVRIVAGVLPVTIVVGGIAMLLLPCLLPPVVLAAWLAARNAPVATAREGMFARATHELFGPLTAMRCVLTRTQRPPHGDAAALALLRDGVSRLDRVAADLRELANGARAAWRVACSDVAIAELVDRTAASLAPVAAAADVAVQVRLAPLAGATCSIDDGRFAQVIANLLHNAIRHAGRGGIVAVRGHRCARHVEIEVADTGPGISAEQRERVFEAGHSSGTGMGLGLTIAREIVTEMGGSLGVRAAPGGGATFVVRLRTT